MKQNFINLILLASLTTNSFAQNTKKVTKVAFTQKPDINWFANNPDADTFYIANADQLAGLAQLVNNAAGVGQSITFDSKTIVLTDDIDISKYGANYNNKKGWIPIGHGKFSKKWPFSYNGFVFSGVFDGNSKRITGLYINDDYFDGIGLFGYIRNGAVKNLGVVNANVTGSEYVGSIAGYFKGEIVNCYSTGRVTGTKSITGGVVGYLEGESSIVDSYSSATVSGGENVGGVVGSVGSKDGIEHYMAKVTNCHFTGTVNGENNIGGVVGNLIGNMANCYSTGTVKGNSHIGGVIGSVDRGDVVFSYSTGDISGKNNVGGVAGNFYGKYNKMTNSYSTGAVKGDNDVGGVVGYSTGNITNSYSTSAISGNENIGGVVGRSSYYGNITNSYSIGVISGNDNVGGVVGGSDNYSNITNSYSTSAVSGRNNVGGIVGSLVNGGIDGCAALNSNVKATGTSFGRIAGAVRGGKLLKNIAFTGIKNNVGNTLWVNKSAESVNGADYTDVRINIDGTFGGRFTNGWTVENGKLPGFGTAVDMPKFLWVDVATKRAERPRIYDTSEFYFTDPRDGQKYKVVEIGSLIWMAENLNYITDNSQCYIKNKSNCQKYGRLYSWSDAMSACPVAWHLPNDWDWYNLIQAAGDSSAVKNLKSTTGWNHSRNGSDIYGFSALPGGYGDWDGGFGGAGDSGNWWSSTSESNSDDAYSYSINYNYESVISNNDDKNYLRSVRCVRD